MTHLLLISGRAAEAKDFLYDGTNMTSYEISAPLPNFSEYPAAVMYQNVRKHLLCLVDKNWLHRALAAAVPKL